MAQDYTEIVGTDLLKNSRNTINENFKVVVSNFSGTDFPAEGSGFIEDGMVCYRTDENKAYRRVNNAWILEADFSDGANVLVANSAHANSADEADLLNEDHVTSVSANGNTGVITVNKKNGNNTVSNTYTLGTVRKVNNVSPVDGNVTISSVASATNATSATKDSAGQNIASTYIKNIALNGTGKIRFTRGNGTTQDITVNTNTFSYSTMRAFTKSTQAAISPKMAGGFTTSQKLTTFTTGAGIAAGTYSLANILQMLIKMSHTHKSVTIAGNNCDCNCDCDCCDCCLAEGTLVVCYEDGGYMRKKIEDVNAGDVVVGANGQLNEVYARTDTRLGEERAMYTFADGSLHFTGEHSMWTRYNGVEYFGIHDITGYYREATAKVDGKPILEWEQEKTYRENGITGKPISKGAAEYGTDKGWKLNKAVVARDKIYPADTPVHTLIVGGNHTFFANGYLVSGFATDEDYDYKNVKIEDLKL